jgi:hypothetical protein
MCGARCQTLQYYLTRWGQTSAHAVNFFQTTAAASGVVTTNQQAQDGRQAVTTRKSIFRDLFFQRQIKYSGVWNEFLILVCLE